MDSFQKCNTSIRHELKNSSALADVFQYDVPILIGKGDLSRSEYNRLLPYENMMGYKDVKYNGKDMAGAEFKASSPI